jgi:hypothetical protein
MRDDDFFKSREPQGSQFWKSLHKVKHLFKWGGGQSIKWRMVKELNSEMMYGLCHPL